MQRNKEERKLKYMLKRAGKNVGTALADLRDNTIYLNDYGS